MATLITDNTETQVHTGPIEEVFIQVNAALTGTIKVIDNSEGTTANVATITNPTVGSSYRFRHFATGVRIIASTTCNISVSIDG